MHEPFCVPTEQTLNTVLLPHPRNLKQLAVPGSDTGILRVPVPRGVPFWLKATHTQGVPGGGIQTTSVAWFLSRIMPDPFTNVGLLALVQKGDCLLTSGVADGIARRFVAPWTIRAVGLSYPLVSNANRCTMEVWVESRDALEAAKMKGGY